jgi:hypothetical protein
VEIEADAEQPHFVEVVKYIKTSAATFKHLPGGQLPACRGSNKKD